MNLRIFLAPFLLAFTLVTSVSASESVFDPAAFQKRFEKADSNKDGKLTREEAFAEFPRMPDYFDEIDSNGDGEITLKEVRRAMESRVNAAMEASKAGKRYALPQQAGNSAVVSSSNPRYFPSRQAAQRYYRFEYYDSIAKRHPVDVLPSEPLETMQAPPQINKPF